MASTKLGSPRLQVFSALYNSADPSPGKTHGMTNARPQRGEGAWEQDSRCAQRLVQCSVGGRMMVSDLLYRYITSSRPVPAPERETVEMHASPSGPQLPMVTVQTDPASLTRLIHTSWPGQKRAQRACCSAKCTAPSALIHPDPCFCSWTAHLFGS